MEEITDQVVDKIERVLAKFSIDLTVNELDEIRDILDEVLAEHISE